MINYVKVNVQVAVAPAESGFTYRLDIHQQHKLQGEYINNGISIFFYIINQYYNQLEKRLTIPEVWYRFVNYIFEYILCIPSFNMQRWFLFYTDNINYLITFNYNSVKIRENIASQPLICSQHFCICKIQSTGVLHYILGLVILLQLV